MPTISNDVEIFYWSDHSRGTSLQQWLSSVVSIEAISSGWYYWLRLVGQHPLTPPMGPFEFYTDAHQAATARYPYNRESFPIEPALDPVLLIPSPFDNDLLRGVTTDRAELTPIQLPVEPEPVPSQECHNCGHTSQDDEDFVSCAQCGDALCGDDDCALYCACDNQGGPWCADCIDRCARCSGRMCAACADDDLCPHCAPEEDEDEEDINLTYFSKHPKILNYETNAEWTFHKEPWENTLYLGIELEMEFEGSAKPFFDISIEHFPNKHLWKYDGSIGPGGELVITPHTLQALRRVNIDKMLKQFSAMGATSYASGQCGLHVHVNRDSISEKDFRKLTRFFVHHEDWLRRFCQRGEKSWGQYCGVPKGSVSEWGCSRYVALNRTSETIEFRIFRGTLDYQRFKASLEFTQAIIEFVKCHSIMTCDSEYGLSEFLQFVRPRYHILTAYIAKRFGLERLYYPKLTLNKEC